VGRGLQGGFKAILIQREIHLLEVCRYVSGKAEKKYCFGNRYLLIATGAQASQIKTKDFMSLQPCLAQALDKIFRVCRSLGRVRFGWVLWSWRSPVKTVLGF
jgi:hypothetical protein